MEFTNETLINQVTAGNLRAVARLITLLENGIPRARDVQRELFKKTGRTRVIGVTGSPGAGKSTIVDQFARELAGMGFKVGVIAIDPTSPFSGGSILGDRIRMRYSSEIDGVYIRSLATRGALGGLSTATWDSVSVLDAAGFDIVLIETVGVGQAEVDIVRLADTCVVVLVPGMGDGVQTIKAGILEIADVFVINKSDREGADALYKDIRGLMSLGITEMAEWDTPIIKTVATSGDGIQELVSASNKHWEWLSSSGQVLERRKKIMKHKILQMAGDLTMAKIKLNRLDLLEIGCENCLNRITDPFAVAQELIA